MQRSSKGINIVQHDADDDVALDRYIQFKYKKVLQRSDVGDDGRSGGTIDVRFPRGD